jgi:hypothetical protein
MRFDYQKEMLESLGLSNAHLIKGRVNPGSCATLDQIHYAFLDMDIYSSMKSGYYGVKNKIVKNGYLLLHDTQNIPSLGRLRDEIILGRDRDMWTQVESHDAELLLILKRK